MCSVLLTGGCKFLVCHDIRYTKQNFLIFNNTGILSIVGEPGEKQKHSHIQLSNWVGFIVHLIKSFVSYCIFYGDFLKPDEPILRTSQGCT